MLVQDIQKEVRALPEEEQKRLMKLMLDLLAQRTEKPTRRRSLRELRGLGKDIWAGIDAQEYIDQQRDERPSFPPIPPYQGRFLTFRLWRPSSPAPF